MFINDLSQLGPGRLCCIDFGLKRIGIAVSNQSRTIATKVICLDNKGFNTTAIYFQSFLKQYPLAAFVVGWPLLSNDTEGSQCTLVQNFCIKLYDSFCIPIIKLDERYSTKYCQEFTQYKHKKVTDDIVATLMLQNFLDWLSISSFDTIC